MTTNPITAGAASVATVAAGLIRAKSFWAITLLTFSIGIGALWFQHLSDTPLTVTQPTFIVVERGSNITRLAQQLVDTGHWTRPLWQLRWLDRIWGSDHPIKVGEYQIMPGTTALGLFNQLRFERPYARSLTFPEGWTVRQWRANLRQTDGLVHKTQSLSAPELAMAVTGSAGPLEGWLLPETYQYQRGDTDLRIFKKAHEAMREHVDKMWRNNPHQGLANKAQLLTLASVVERESGINNDRRKIARVFLNRLQQGMRLQSDPTIIYGLGTAFDGDLKRRHLRSDGPFNTYTRHGLPPTPICNPGPSALRAVLKPADGDWLYFVGRGDGSSQFSHDLDAHNDAVNQYQRRK